jgi:hypothetical protein
VFGPKEERGEEERDLTFDIFGSLGKGRYFKIIYHFILINIKDFCDFMAIKYISNYIFTTISKLL